MTKDRTCKYINDECIYDLGKTHQGGLECVICRLQAIVEIMNVLSIYDYNLNDSNSFYGLNGIDTSYTSDAEYFNDIVENAKIEGSEKIGDGNDSND